MSIPEELLFSEDHEWVRVEGDEAVIGVTEFAVEQLGEIVFVELPDPKAVFAPLDVYGVIESAKAASDLICPIGGQVVASNPALTDSPELVNTDPYGEGWLVRLKVADVSEIGGLKDASAYQLVTEGSVGEAS